MERATGFVLVAAVLGGACQATRTSLVRTGAMRAPVPADRVQLSMLEPQDAEPLGIVQAYRGEATSVEELLPEFKRAVAQAGGNYGKIDAVGVKFEEAEETRTESCECGTAEEPRTCTATRAETVEVATLQVLGRAFLVTRVRP